MTRRRQTRRATGCHGTTRQGRAVCVRMRVPALPFNSHAPLFVRHPAQRQGLVVAMANMKRLPKAYSIAVHGARCPFGVVLWPRVVPSDGVDEAKHARAERDANCTCVPLVMYTGASA